MPNLSPHTNTLAREKKKRYFPCQICKGSGIIEYGEKVDGQQVSPDLDCGNCDGLGMIEIGGEIHLRNKAISLGLKHLTEDREYTWDELLEIGRKYL